MTVAAFSQGLP